MMRHNRNKHEITHPYRQSSHLYPHSLSPLADEHTPPPPQIDEYTQLPPTHISPPPTLLLTSNDGRKNRLQDAKKMNHFLKTTIVVLHRVENLLYNDFIVNIYIQLDWEQVFTTY